jgi:hypothetical protein
MTVLDPMDCVRSAAAQAANAADAKVWRWFSTMMEERRIRWCLAGCEWLVSVDHRHVATDACFDNAIRTAMDGAGRRVVRRPAARQPRARA